MAALPVVKYGDPILARKMQAVEDFSEPRLRSLVQDMFDTMYEEEGIGLAANQVGVDLNLLVIDITHVDPSRESPNEGEQPNPEQYDRPSFFSTERSWRGGAILPWRRDV